MYGSEGSHIIDHFQMGELCGVRVCTASTPSIKTLPNVGPRRPLAHVGKCSCMFGLFGPKQIRINWAHDNGFFFAKTCGKLFGCTVGETHGSSFLGIEMAESKLNSHKKTNKRIGLFNVHCCTLPKTNSKGIKGMVGQNNKCRAMRKEIGSRLYWNFTSPWIDFALQHPRSPSILV